MRAGRIGQRDRLPKNLTESGTVGQDDGHTTATVEPLSSVNIGALALGAPGVLTVGTLSDAPPNICINPAGQFSGFDNQLLSAIANKLGLQVRFVGTDFSGLLAQVASRRLRLRLLLACGAAGLSDHQLR
jgi:polar amino acid transport system substrate-binding protein